MTLRMTQQELDDLRKRTSPPAAPGGNQLLHHLIDRAQAGRQPGLRHKFHAVRVERDGFSFPSKMEGAYYELLKLEQRAGTVLFFLMQVPFHVPASPTPVVYRLDFLVFMADGRVRLVEVKGQQTEGFKIKRRLVEHHFAPAKLELWRLRGKQWEEITDVAA